MTTGSLAVDEAGSRSWDAVVIGAGPAGALAARQIAAGGASVLLVEKKPFPRWKVCGACLNGQALAVLESVGLGDLAAQLGAIPLDTFDLRLPGRRLRLPLPWGVAIPRARFDAALVEAAVAAGAAFLPETHAQVGELQGESRCVLLQHLGRIVAAGARIVVVAAGLGPACLPHSERVQVDSAPGSRIGAGCVLEAAPDAYREGSIFMAVGRSGYVGLVRQGEDELNVAAAFDPDFVRHHGSPARAAAAVLDGAGMEPIAALADAHWQGTPALTRSARPPAGERWFLIGDAAGYTEPFTGQGMAWALRSARALAPLATRALARWEPAVSREWASRYHRQIGRAQWLCRGLAAGLRHPALARAGADVLRRFPALAGPFVAHLNSARPMPERIVS
jgi:flavin-dependent dehydrogenase